MSTFAKLYASLESEAPQEAVETTTVEDVVEVQEQAQNVAEAQAEVAEIEKAIDTGLQEVENLNVMANQLENSIPEGGAEPMSAQIAEMAIESIYRRLGIKAKAMPSLEEFNDHRSRIEATKLAVEGIREVANKVWTVISTFFKNLWQAILRVFEHVKNLFRNNEKVLNNLIDIITPIKKEATLKGGALNRLLADFFEVKDNNLQDTVKRVSKLRSTLYKISTISENTAKTVDKITDEVLSSIDPNETVTYKQVKDKINTFVTEPCKALDNLADVKTSTKTDLYKAHTGAKIVSETVIGNRGFIVYHNLFSFGAQWFTDNNNKQDKELLVNKSDVLKVLELALDITKEYNKLNINKAFSDFDKAIKDNKRKFEQLKTDKFKTSNKISELKNNIIKLAKIVGEAQKTIINSQALFSNYAISLGKQFRAAPNAGGEETKEETKEEAKAE